jgi:hypothetical protein
MKISGREETLPEDEDEIEKEVEIENEDEEEKMAKARLEEGLNREVDLLDEVEQEPSPGDEEALTQVDRNTEAELVQEEPEPEGDSESGDSSGFFAARRV